MLQLLIYDNWWDRGLLLLLSLPNWTQKEGGNQLEESVKRDNIVYLLNLVLWSTFFRSEHDDI